MAERYRLTLHVVNVGAGLANIIEVDEDNTSGMRSSNAARSCGRSCPDPTVYYTALLASSETTFIIDDIIYAFIDLHVLKYLISVHRNLIVLSI